MNHTRVLYGCVLGVGNVNKYGKEAWERTKSESKERIQGTVKTNHNFSF